MSWRYHEITSSSFGYNKSVFEAERKVLKEKIGGDRNAVNNDKSDWRLFSVFTHVRKQK